jgi:hypothetical protein
MTLEEFNQLMTNRRNLIAELGESLSEDPPKFKAALLYANELIVELLNYDADLMGDDEGIEGGEEETV